jgi:hypothetical protein
MSMQALNQLVARSIMDTNVLESFKQGRIGEILRDYEFAPELRQQIEGLNAQDWTEFAILSYRVVKAAEVPARRVVLPSPLEGLVPDDAQSDEQVA